MSHPAPRTGAAAAWATVTTLALAVVSALAVPLSACAQPVTWTNGIGMTFVRIPAGSFRMGASGGDREATAAERPAHTVRLTRAFYLGQTEVTQAQWERVMGRSSFAEARSNPFIHLPGMAERLRHPDHPATVSWQDAQDFLARLNALEARPAGQRYRLPTEAEWEYAARAGTTTAYSFGNDAGQLGRHAWYGENFGTGSTHPVATKLPNPWGLYDVHGNVWEWVSDWYADGYTAGDATDPTGPATGTEKVVRGGSWHVTSGGWRSSWRKPYPVDYRGLSIGFRVLLERVE